MVMISRIKIHRSQVAVNIIENNTSFLIPWE